MDKNNIQELFTARIQNASLTILGYSTDYVVVQVPMKSRYVFFRLSYKSRTTYNRIINTQDGKSFVKKYFTYTVEDLAAPMWTDAKTGEMHRGTSTISIPRNKIFCGLYHADLVMLDTKDEYDKYYLDRLSNDYLLKYPKTMKLYFKGYQQVRTRTTGAIDFDNKGVYNGQ